MKTIVYDLYGRKAKDMNLPSFFSANIREDIVWKVLESRKKIQPFGTSVIAGKQHSASGIIRRKRHAWKISYGYGISRVPRKIISQRGNRFNWIGAEVSGTRGGRRAHPSKSWKNFSGKINKKEEKIALISALSASANPDFVKKKYASLQDKKIDVPFVIDNEISKLKTKQFLLSLKNILKELYRIAIPRKSIRAGKGKMRGRKYKKTAGVLIIVSNSDNLKINGLEIKKARDISILDLAKGGPGRLVVYTENAIKDLDKRIMEKK